MMALLWDDIQEDLTSAKGHFAQAVTLYRTGVGDYVSSMAFQHAMQSGYTRAGLARRPGQTARSRR